MSRPSKSVLTILATAAAFGIDASRLIPDRQPPKIINHDDYERMTKAERKRQRKAERRMWEQRKARGE